MVPRLAALLLLLPAVALAQSAGSITISESNDSDGVIGIAECNGTVSDTLAFSWTVSTNNLIPTGNSFALAVSDTSGCPVPSTSNSAHTATVTTVASNGSTSGTYTGLAVPSLLFRSGLNFSCSVPATVFVCATVTDAAGTTVSANGSIQLDVAVPPAPVLSAVSPGDSALGVTWTTGSTVADGGTVGTAASYEVYVAQHGAPFPPIGAPSATVTAPTLSARVGGLKNGVEYDVVVYALSAGGNRSDASNILSGTPVQVDDFWTSYKKDGGRDSGGCSSGSAGAMALLLSPLLLLARKRRRS